LGVVHFASRNLRIVGTAIRQIAIIAYFTNFYDAFCATPGVPLRTETIIATCGGLDALKIDKTSSTDL